MHMQSKVPLHGLYDAHLSVDIDLPSQLPFSFFACLNFNHVLDTRLSSQFKNSLYILVYSA